MSDDMVPKTYADRECLQVCNFTNAVFFWAVLPETAKRPLEEMRNLFTNAPWFVPTMKSDKYRVTELERRVQEVEQKTLHVDHHESA